MSNVGIRCAIILVLTAACLSGSAAEKTAKRSSKNSAKATSTENEPTASRRLPRYFASFVDSEQRKEIYEIQASFQVKIIELKEALAKLEAEQMEEIESVLTATQREQLDELREHSAKADKNPPKSKSASSAKTKSRSSKSTGSSKRSRSRKSATADSSHSKE